MKLLIVEDDKNLKNLLKKNFIEEGLVVDVAFDGEEGEYLAITNSYDIIILDWMLPIKNGIEILKNLRNKNILTPIIMLTAKGELKDKVTGLKNGADDYLTKPFSFEELQARIEALYRRTLKNASNIINLKNITIDLDRKQVTMDEKIISLSQKEYELLLFLIKYKNSFVSKNMIENELWNSEKFISSNVIEVTIHNLRKKLYKELIKNFRGLGYKIEV
jgi:DNA-binding response OmpR family regulator